MERISKSDLEQAAMKLLQVNLRLRKGEKVVLVTDRKKDPIFEAFKKVIPKMGGKLTIARVRANRAHGSPIPEVAEILLKADVIVAPTTKSITHCLETKAAAKKGARVATLPGITPELVVKAAKADLKEIMRISNKLYKSLKNSKVVNVITPSGTNFRMRRKYYKFSMDAGVIRKHMIANLPNGEIFCYFKGGNGKVVIDSYGKLLEVGSGATLEIRNGKIIKWNKAADPFIKMLKDAAGECGLQTVELGIGTNPEHKEIMGNVLHDEKIYGSAHIAFGGGGKIRVCPVHADVILMRPTIWVDGRKVMEKGKLIK